MRNLFQEKSKFSQHNKLLVVCMRCSARKVDLEDVRLLELPDQDDKAT